MPVRRFMALLLAFVLVPFLVQLVTGILSRSAPSLNLMAMGLPAGVLAGLAGLIISAPLIFDQFTGLTGQGVHLAARVIAR